MEIQKIIHKLNNEFPGVEFIYNHDKPTQTHVIMILNKDLIESIEFTEFSFKIYNEFLEDDEDILFVDSESILYSTDLIESKSFTFEFENSEFNEELNNGLLDEDSAITISSKMNDLQAFIPIDGLVKETLDSITHTGYETGNDENSENNLELAA